jgi:putative ABC transport system permease protein
MISFRFIHLLRLSLQSLALHWLRSLLTMLSVVLGVASVIVMLAVGEAARYEAVRQIQELGAANIILRSIKPADDKNKDEDENAFLRFGISAADMQRISETIKTVVSVTPIRQYSKDVRHHDRIAECRVVSVLPNYESLNNIQIARGRFITELDNENFENVAVLGPTAAAELFPVEDPIGKTVQIGAGGYDGGLQYFRVVGVTEPKAVTTGAGSAVGGQDYNLDVYIPFETDRLRIGQELISFKSGTYKIERIDISQLTVIVDRMEHVRETAEVIDLTMAQFHPRKDYEIIVPLELIEQAEKAQRLFSRVLGAIAGISLLIGGIGIMNIMLATVTERTREIGIRRALGAKQRDIGQQFLVETMTLSSLGGLLGILTGILLSWIVKTFFGFQTILTPWAALLAFAVSLVVGLIFGTYPAYRAARMDPIEALRHE